MQRLAGAHELLDGPLDDVDELAGNLRDLGRVNRWLFGSSLSIRAVDALLGGTDPAVRARIVDVGTGAADIPLALLAHAERAGRTLEVVGVDSRAEVIEAARRLEPGLADRAGLSLVVSDGRSLPFDDRSFDLAHTSLVLHHLEPDDAVALLRELRRVSTLGVVINDVLRSRLALFGARALAAVASRNRLSRNDGPLSVRRAYTEPEIVGLLARAGLRPMARLRDPFRHRIAIAARPAEP